MESEPVSQISPFEDIKFCEELSRILDPAQ
jgi:hypothetical protein